jgi:hypothetical protein
MKIFEDIDEEEAKASSVEEIPLIYDTTLPFDPPKVEPLISLYSLIGFFVPQTLKLIGYIKHRKFIILFESGITDNFIHCHISKENNLYICVVNNFQIMISNGRFMKCGGHCENVHLQIGQYHLKYHMFSINMGGCDIVLSTKWLCTINPILMDFKDLTMKVHQEGQQYKFQGITIGSLEIISSHRMENILKKYCSRIISQLHSIHIVQTHYVNLDLHYILSRHRAIFNTCHGLPPSCSSHDHSIPLVPGSIPPNVFPYHHPLPHKNEIEKNIQELLEVDVIHPSTKPYYSLVVIVLNK